MKKTVALWMGLLVSTFGNSAFANFQKMNIKKIQGQISRSNANWRAKESWVTRLSEDEIQRILGLRTLPQGDLDFESMSSKKQGTSTSGPCDESGKLWELRCFCDGGHS
jgi:hypothetical protein